MNIVILIGRLTKDPELKYTPGKGTAVTSVVLAVDKFNSSTGQKEADFIQVVIWGKQAESTANYMAKGSLMAVTGKIQTRSYDAKDGTKKYITEVVATGIKFLESKKNGNNNSSQQFNGNFDDMEIVDGGDIPF